MIRRPAQHVWLAGMLAATACESHQATTTPARERSPNASIMPAPLASANELLGPPKPTLPAADSSAATGSGGGGGASGHPEPSFTVEPVPTPLNPLHALPDDEPRSKDQTVFSLEALWRWPEIDLGPLEPEADTASIETERKLGAPKVIVDLSATGRMRWVWASSAFALPSGSELRARYDVYGHALVWPDGSKYRVLGAGALKAVLAERRADATPLLGSTVREHPGKPHLGYPSVASELVLPDGETLLLEQIRLDDVYLGGPLLCRLLLELAAVKPSSEACRAGLLPVYAEFHWVSGSAVFEVTSLNRKTDLAPRSLLVPPAEAEFETSGLPEADGVIADSSAQHALHNRDRTTKRTASRGLIAANFSPLLGYLVLDRVRVAWVAPARTVELADLRPGRYHVAWHDFFGRLLQPTEVVEVPGRIVVGDGETEALAPSKR